MSTFAIKGYSGLAASPLQGGDEMYWIPTRTQATNPHSLGKSGKMAPKIPLKAVGFRRPPRGFGVFDFFDLPKL